MIPSRLRLLALSATLLLLPRAAAAQLPDLPVGDWAGSAAVKTSATPDGVEVELHIAADSSVSGRVGDATLRAGRIIRNPSLPARLLGLGTTWVIEADLVGPIVRGHVTRSRVRMPISPGEGGLVGDLNAGRGRELVSVRLRLRRIG
jgi:hypothetical protein